ncbi:structure-specific endonuclease subunit SLX4 [Astyanax mexicanus]|uniref:structure-specific endonuclease subunit SLX4 n=1 Tax=Astyanax mexicanus TaxID=7994 RepID=UPI0020CAB1E5|nr:structure-specific endonuclease subunit SLX4 [Astyanax mexicanus]
MDDSDQEFSDLCSRLLKRVKRKDSGDEKKPVAAPDEAAGPSQSRAPPRRKRQKNGQLQSQAAGRSQPVCPADGASFLSVKEKVLRRMERFRRESPPRLLHVEAEEHRGETVSPPRRELKEETESDEALARRLQQQLDHEAETQAVVDTEGKGLFLCQLCYKDLSAMSPQLRTQHINRCLDESESSSEKISEAPAAPASALQPRVPECPICGRGFKSEKSRSTHLKRCSASMGVSPAELLQALQRQASESLSDSAAEQEQPRGRRRPNASEPSMPVKKKAKKRAPRMDEDTMVALALSRSLLEQEKQRERDIEEERQIQAQLSSPPAAAAPVLQWRPGAGKSQGRRRKGAPAGPPPLLLVQDPQTALNRIQERVSALLLRPRPPTPPTPKLLPSMLSMWRHSTPLWLKSALPGGGPDSLCEFYTPELGAFIQPWVRPENKTSLSSEVTPVKQRPASASEPTSNPEQPSCASVSLDQKSQERSSTPACLTPTFSTPGAQALQDLVELAEEGMTLTQYRHTDKEPTVLELPLSGFVPGKAKTTKLLPTSSVSVSRLCSDLASMVNNPQLSDVQLQVDSGDLYFAHSFMLYTRCPLLANLVHDSGFGVQEDGMPAAQRVLLGDVPGEAVHALLHYLYTALCPLSHTLLPHILQLASRFNLPELQQQCEQYFGNPEDSEEPRADEPCPAEDLIPEPQQSLADTQFLELLRSMWRHEESDCEDFSVAGGAERGMEEVEEEGGGSNDGEMKEERVDEEELDEIYEFAATQRKIGTIASSSSYEEDEVKVMNDFFDEEKEDKAEKLNMKEEKCEEERAALFKNTSSNCYELEVNKGTAAVLTSGMNVHHTQGASADVCSGSVLDTSGLKSAPEAGLDRSYSRLFSESWGEYVEPSQTPAASFQPKKSISTPHRMSSVSEVIDLSISPPPGSEEPGELSLALPVAGVSPGERQTSKSSLIMVSRTPEISSPVPASALGPLARSKQSPVKERSMVCSSLTSVNSPSLSYKSLSTATWSKGSPGAASSIESKCSPLVLSNPSKSQPKSSPPVPNYNKPELIVLSDCSDDTDADPPANQDSPPLSPSPPKANKSHTPIRAKESKPSLHNRTDKMEPSKTDHLEDCLYSAANHSMLDGSAEVSWLIPATPEVSTRSCSTQTYNSMQRSQLFPKPHSSSPQASSSVPQDSEMSRSAEPLSSSIRGGPACSSLRSDPCSSSEHSTDIQKPVSCSRLQFDTPQSRGQTHHSALPSFMPSSSTPLHSAPCPQPPEPLGSPLLRHSDFRPQRRAAWEEEDCEDKKVDLSLSDRLGKMAQFGTSELGFKVVSQSESLQSQRGCVQPREDARDSPPGSPAHTEAEDETGTREQDHGGTVDEDNRSNNEVEMVEEVSFCAFDEPPIAFDDSWGLGGGEVNQGPRFSLRLESSGDAGSPLEHRRHVEMPPQHTNSPPIEEAHAISPDSGAAANHSLPDPAVWESWGEDEDEDDKPDKGPALPLFQRAGVVAPPKRVAELKTPVAHKNKNQVPLVPITPMPGFSDMDTPELRKRLDSYGVRPLPKKQMVLKLKEIHHYTHQLMSSESEEEDSPRCRPKTGANPFKLPTAPPPVSPRKLQFGEEEQEVLPASQDSSTSSTAESERSNPELCDSEEEGSDSEGVTASQAVVREKDKLLAVRSFIVSDPALYGRVLQYQPLSLSDLKARLRAAGIRLGTAKLLDFLDSQCITFTTARAGHAAPSRRKARARAPAAKPRGAASRGRKRGAKPAD